MLRCQLQAFLNVATGGFGTELTVKTDEDLKNKLGGAAYLFTGIRHSRRFVLLDS